MATQLTALFSFDGSNGTEPFAGLTADASGDLFGTTLNGGANNYGAVFEIKNTGTTSAPSYASAPSVVVSFDGFDGGAPEAGLIADANGDLFGTSAFDGASDDGTVFEIENTGTAAAPVYASAPTTLGTFSGSNGQQPEAGLTTDANSDLFGTTYTGGANNDGTVFEIENTGTAAAPVYASAPTTLLSFSGSTGQQPEAGLITDANGDLFGTAYSGGANNYGTVFEVKNTGTVAAPIYGSSPTTLLSFNGSNGQAPKAGLTADARGDLFGTTELGGANGVGTVFEIQNIGTAAAPVYASAPTLLVSFNGLTDGDYPTAALIVDANGDLFGTTNEGGTNGDGTVFEIKNIGTVASPIYSGSPITLASLNGSNGNLPLAGLIADANGDLFGTAVEGGANGDGTVFEVAPIPTISGTLAGQTTTFEAPLKPFGGVTVSEDFNADATDTLTITLSGAGGTLADSVGFSSLVSVGSGVYALSGTASAITSELNALVFTPKVGAPNTSSITTFTLSDQSSAYATPAADSTTSVIDRDPATPPNFFNNDNEAGILWQNSNGDTELWNPNGSGGYAGEDLGVVGGGWQIAGTGAFNGASEASILWRNSGGDTELWNPNGSGGYVGEDLGVVPTSWQIEGTGDFNGAGEGILWRNAGGDTLLWNSNGSGGFAGHDLGVVPTSWQIEGTGDFTGTGEDSILWQNSNGDTELWNPSGSGGFVGENLGVVGGGWQIAGTGDFTGTGEDSILWRNSGGDTELWNPNGSGGFTGEDLGVVATSWQIVETGDFSGSGQSGILWRNSGGDTELWNPNGSGGFTGKDLGIAPASWSVHKIWA